MMNLVTKVIYVSKPNKNAHGIVLPKVKRRAMCES